MSWLDTVYWELSLGAGGYRLRHRKVPGPLRGRAAGGGVGRLDAVRPGRRAGLEDPERVVDAGQVQGDQYSSERTGGLWPRPSLRRAATVAATPTTMRMMTAIPRSSIPPWFSGQQAKRSGRNAQKAIISATVLQNGVMIKSVAMIVVPNFSIFEFATAFEVFGIDRSDRGNGVPAFDFRVCTPDAGRCPAQVRAVHARRSRAGSGSGRGPGDDGALRPGRGRPRIRPGRAAGRPRPRRLGHVHLLRGVRPGPGRPAGRPPLHHALALLPGARQPVPRCPGG